MPGLLRAEGRVRRRLKKEKKNEERLSLFLSLYHSSAPSFCKINFIFSERKWY